MPTRQQLRARRTFEFLHGRERYSDTTNIRGSAYIGRTKGYLRMQAEEREWYNRAYSIHKKFKSDISRQQ